MQEDQKIDGKTNLKISEPKNRLQTANPYIGGRYNGSINRSSNRSTRRTTVYKN